MFSRLRFSRPRYMPDNFMLALLATVALASFLPSTGQMALLLDQTTTIAVGLLFFLHGAKLPREAVTAGVMHWRLHLLVLATTFLLFPLLGMVLGPLLTLMVGPELYLGVLFLCMLPSTVQSSIAFTSVARGNVPAAVCSASASNVAGIFVTPLLVGLLLASQVSSGSPLDAILRIVGQLLLPFMAGQVAQRWIGAWVGRHKGLLKVVDQGTILLVVYCAFGEAVVEGLWQQLPATAIVGVLAADAILLALVLLMTTLVSRRLGFGREDEIVIVFCGSKKSLASGVPIAKVLFAGSAVGMMVLPLMLFHQMQLMVCAFLASRYARSAANEAIVPAATGTLPGK